MPEITPEIAAKALALRQQKQPTPEQARAALEQRYAKQMPYSQDVPVGTENIESLQQPNPNLPNPTASPGQIANRALGNVNYLLEPGRAAGEGLRNTFGQLGQAVANPVERMLGMPEGQYQPENTTNPDRAANQVMRAAGGMAPGMLVNPASVLSRIGLGVLEGEVLNPQDREAGGAAGGIYASIAEMLPGGLKGLGEVGEKFTRSKFTKDMAEKIAFNANEAKESALGYLKPIMSKYGDKNIAEKGMYDIVQAAEDNKQYLTGTTKKSYEKFLEQPTFENAHRFQSDLATKTRKIKGKDATSINEIEALADIRDSSLKALNEGFEGMSPEAAKDFNKFRTAYATDVAPYLNNKDLKSIARLGGSKHKLTPGSLEDAIYKALESESTSVAKNHQLRKQAEELTKKREWSELYKNVTPAKFMEHFGYDISSKVLQNPQLEKALGAIEPYYRKGAQGAIGAQLSPENDLFQMNQMIANLIPRKEESQ